MTSTSSETMPDLLPKSQAKGVDFCGGDKEHHYIIRSDLGCYMHSTDVHQGLDLTVYNLHPSCQGGDHYLASKDRFYIIRGNSFRCVSDISKDLDAKVCTLHPNCQNGDHYLCAKGSFYIIFQSRGKFHKTSDLTKAGNEYSLDEHYSDGLYYWGTEDYIYLVKPKNQWGVQFHKTEKLREYNEANKSSIHADVLNFLPGGLAVTCGPAFAKWDLIKMIANESNTSTTWEKRITRKVGYTKSKSLSIERNWKVSSSIMVGPGTLIEKIIKFQFTLSAEYGGKKVNTENESWEEATEVEEKVNLTLEPKRRIYVWQYKLGFGKEDILFCRDIIFNNGPEPPTDTPLINQDLKMFKEIPKSEPDAV